MTHDPLSRCERRLRRAAAPLCRRLADPAAGDGRELGLTLLRLGFPLGEVAALSERRSGPGEEVLARMASALARELARLARHARGALPSYDLNRHIAVFRARRQFQERFAGPAAAPS